MHIGKIENGIIRFYNRDRFVADLNKLEGKEFQLTIGKLTNKRSDKQNKFLWSAVYTPISEYLGYTKEEIHDAFKWRFLRVERGRLETVRSTVSLNREEMIDYIEKIRLWLTDNDIDIYIPTIDDFYGYSYQTRN